MAHVPLRMATLEDIPILVRHRRLMWWDMGRRDQAALEMMETAARSYFARALPDGSYRGYLALSGTGEVIGGGGVVISPWPGVLGQLEPKRAMILNLYVEHEHRRQGIALRLMETMVRWCRENGFSGVALHASDKGRALYEKLGFQPTNEMRLDFDEPAPARTG